MADQPGDRWGDPVSEGRQAELKTLADQQRGWATAADHQGRESYFKDVKLTGADVFWLAAYALAGPEGDVAAAQERLRTASARDEEFDLSALHLAGASLRGAHLERADLTDAHLERADLLDAHLERADLTDAHLERATLVDAHLAGASLRRAHLEGADLYDAHLEGATLDRAHLEGANLRGYLERADLTDAHLERADLYGAHLAGAHLTAAHLEGASLRRAHLEGKTYAPGDADLTRIQQWAWGFPATLLPADLRGAFLSTTTILTGIRLGDAQSGTVQVADVRWGGVNLAVVDWTPFTDTKAVLGDEQAAWGFKAEPFTETEEQRQRPPQEGARARADHDTEQSRERLLAFQASVRANRQLATALRDQGMNEEADYFAYRAQVVQRRVFHLQGKRFRAGFSRFLDLLAGYGYAPQRSLIWYVLAVLGFATLYLVLAHLPPQEALILSVTSFHGRGFPGNLSLHDPIMAVAAAEAIFGLLIEVTFIATFTQRFFAR